MREIGLAWAAAGAWRGAVATLVFTGFVLSLLEAGTLLVLFGFVTSLVSPGAAAPRALQALFARLGEMSPVAMAVLILVLSTLRFLLGLWQEWRMARLWVSIRQDMQETMLEKHLHSQFGYLAQRKLGEHLHNILDSPSFAAVFYLHLVRFLSTAIMLAVLLATLLAVSPFLLMVAAAIGLAYLLVIRWISTGLSYRLGVQRSAAVKRQTELVSEGISGARYLKLLRHYPEWLREFSSAAAQATHVMHRSGFWNTFPARSLEYLVILFFLGMVLHALEGWSTFRTESIPTIAVYFLGIVRMLPSLYVMGSGRTEMMQVLPNLQRYIELRSTLPQESLAGGTETIPSLAQHPIRFSGVNFSYGDNHVLHELELEIRPGSVTAIAGLSGQGKSTLLDLMLRLIEPSGGRITLDATDISSYNLAAWRDRFAYVGQDPFLFHDSIRANVLLGNPAATAAEVDLALALAAVPAFANALPQGVDTVLAEGGRSLSGGQRQRVALARALVSRAEVLLFDEPTSQLDPDTERKVLAGALSQRGERTIVLVTHREDVLRLADRVIVLHEGRIIESGSYDELQRAGAQFRRIFQVA